MVIFDAFNFVVFGLKLFFNMIANMECEMMDNLQLLKYLQKKNNKCSFSSITADLWA